MRTHSSSWTEGVLGTAEARSNSVVNQLSDHLLYTICTASRHQVCFPAVHTHRNMQHLLGVSTRLEAVCCLRKLAVATLELLPDHARCGWKRCNVIKKSTKGKLGNEEQHSRGGKCPGC